MCGIVAGFSKKGKRISKSIMKRYEAQKHRGSEGFGYVAFYKDGNGGKIAVGRDTEEKGIRTKIMNEHSGMIMFHHRLPTSTPNVEEATHPIYISHDELDHDYFVVHNGVVRNSLELRPIHEKLGYVYNTVIETEVVTHIKAKKTGTKYYVSGTKAEKFNDSESLAIEVARVLDGMTSNINTVGTVAFVAWQINKENGKLMSISYGHNSGNPLTITDNNDHFFLTSLGGTDLPEDILYTLITDGKDLGTTKQKSLCIGYLTEWAKTQGYNKYTYTHTPTTPTLPAPKLNNDIKKKGDVEYKKNTTGLYETADDYYADKYGFVKERKLEWDKEEEKTKNKCGFDTTLHEDKDGDETLTEEGDFEVVTALMVKNYLELEDSKISVMADIDAGEYLLKGNPEVGSVAILTKDIKDSEDKLEIIQAEMNDIEDRYCELYPNHVGFKKLVDAYVEQGDIESEYSLPYIQMYEEKTLTLRNGHF